MECPQPIASRDTPSVPGLKPGKHVLGSRCDQIVADGPLVLEELSGDNCTDGMATEIGVVRVACPVPHPACQRIAATGFEFAAENVASGHASIMALLEGDLTSNLVDKRLLLTLDPFAQPTRDDRESPGLDVGLGQAGEPKDRQSI